ncbi:guanylate kinase [Salsipaludibacter albus]|uniref:guanylate kinase n=1 Tax=Salsipaludibacter albus TaxID=2849650 RepID=UPI001EE4419F|nr:guanylate kinase [Salsipaludibacter albus]
MSGLLVVVAGPSGVGKGTVLGGVMDVLDEAEKSVSATTREPRPDEREGVHYHFVEPDEFARLVAADAFLEHAQFAGHWYGTLRTAVAERLARGRVVILEIEVQGAAQVAERVPEALRIFLAPPDMDELRRRLAARGTEDDAQVEARLDRARVELAAADSFDHVVVNDQPDRAVAEVVELIERARRDRISRGASARLPEGSSGR